MADDEVSEFRPQLITRHDAEIAADVGDDGADGLAANSCCNLLQRRQLSENAVGIGCGNVCQSRWQGNLAGQTEQRSGQWPEGWSAEKHDTDRSGRII